MTRRIVVLVASFLSVLVALPTGAQPTQRPDSDSIFEQITVTAKKREESIYEVPVAVSAFSGATIEKQGITDLVDIGKFVPNLNVTTFSAGHTSSANPFIRGIGLQDHLITTDPGVSVYVDGVYLGRQVGQNWSLANVERVEVLRGPQGTLYGRNSIGGAINIITKQPGSDEGARVGVTLGTEGRVNAEFFADTALSETLGLSIGGAVKRRDGSGRFLNIPNADKDVGELRDISARVALQWEPNDRLTLLLAADGNEGDNGLNPYTTLIDEVGLVCRQTAADPSTCANGAVYDAGFRNTDISSNPYDNNTGQESQTVVKNQAYGISLTADYALTDELTAKLIVSDRHSDYESGLDDDSFFDDFLSFPETGRADQTSIELQINGEYDRWSFVAGAYSFDEDGVNDQNPTVFLGNAGTFTLGQDVDSRAIYGNIGYQWTDELRISAGLRFTDDEKRATIDINDSLIDTSAHRGLVGGELGDRSNLRSERQHERVRNHPKRLPVRTISGASVLLVWFLGFHPTGQRQPAELLRRTGRQHYGRKLRGRIQGHADRLSADERRGLLYPVLRSPLPGQHHARRRFRHPQRHRRSGLVRRGVGRHLGGEQRLPHPFLAGLH